MKSFLRLPDDYEIVELKAPKGILNKTVSEMNFARNYHLNLITVKRTFEEKINGEISKAEHVIGVPQDDTVFFENDTVILIGKTKDVERFVAINN
jgi:trk system potassium uptake protein